MAWKVWPARIALSFLLAMVAGGQQDPGAAKGKIYTITGAVKRPGSFPLTKPTTVFEAINLAGGFLDNQAVRTDIQIVRGERTLHFNYVAYTRGKDRDQNIRLEDGDAVAVGANPPASQLDGPRLPPAP